MVSIGVAIPTYDREKHLGVLLESIPSDMPIYVSDNGSFLTPAFKDRFPTVDFRSISGNPVPPLANWNVAAKMVKEDWVIIPSDDDLYYKDSFNIIRDYLELYNFADLVIFGHNAIDENYKKIGEWSPKNKSVCEAPMGFEFFKYGVEARMPSIIFKRKLLERLDFFDENFKITAGDSDLVQRALIQGLSVFIPKIVSGYRIWVGGSTHKTISSIEWMREIDRWGEKLSCNLRGLSGYSCQAATIKAELYAQNLISGIASAKKTDGYFFAWSHMLRCKYPLNAKLGTQVKLIFNLLKP